MRRKDREVTDPGKINEIIRQCTVCRIGFHDGGRVYIVPLHFGFTEQDGKRVFYFHSAKQGRKVDLAKAALSVGFELDTNYAMLEADTACAFSARFQSVIGSGTISIVEDAGEKETALQEIMYHCTGKRDWSFQERMVDSICVLKLVVEELACKEHV